MTKRLTDPQYKALTVLSDRKDPVRARAFAEFMWPDNTMHTKTSNQGRGACHGKAAWLSGGSYLGKLKKKGWVREEFDYFLKEFTGYKLTEEGRRILAQENEIRNK